MILQEIGDEIIAQIKSRLQGILNAPLQGFGLGIKTPAGLVVSADVSQNGERVPYGIEDNKGTYFYLRYNGPVLARKLQKGEKVGSCNEVSVQAKMRLILVHRCKNAQGLLLAVQNAFSHIEFSGVTWSHGQKKVQLLETGFNFIGWDIFSEETGKPKNEFISSAIQLVAIDFDIKLNTNYNYCTIKLC
jgi:hypothetical protein